MIFRKNAEEMQTSSKSVVDRLVDNIIEAIITKEFRPGDKIPTESELSEMMGMSRNSVREAVKILVAYGILEVRRAEGTFVVSNYNDKMLNPMVYGIILSGRDQAGLIETRRIIDTGVLSIVIEKVTDKEMGELEDALEALKRELFREKPSAERIFDADVAFHQSIMRLTQNDILNGIGIFVDRITKLSRIKTTENIIAMHRLEELYEMHREIISVLRRKELSKVSPVIADHYKYWIRTEIEEIIKEKSVDRERFYFYIVTPQFDKFAAYTDDGQCLCFYEK